MPASFCVHLADRAVLTLAGEDARPFLQGLISNDIVLLTPDRALYAALLTPQGKYLFDFILAEKDGVILLDAERERAGELRQRLLMYRLRSKVAIETAEDLAVIALLGPGAAEALAPSEGESGGMVRFVDPRLPELGVRVILESARIEGFAARQGCTLADGAAYDRHRLALGVPDASRDLVPQKTILLESGFEELNGVSFTKGCFVGQELTARTKHRGLVKRRLFPVRIEGALPAPGAIITAGEQEAGEMRSGHGERGMALLRLQHAHAALQGEVELVADGSRVRPEVPDWMRLPS